MHNTTQTARGTFDITDRHSGGERTFHHMSLGETRLEKRFTGDIVGVSRVQMLAADGESAGSAFVALEEFDGDIDGRRGSFMLAHRGIRGGEREVLELDVVPGSGCGELSSIHGSMSIDIDADGLHHVVLEYSLGPEH